jgi:hypothetical protein
VKLLTKSNPGRVFQFSASTDGRRFFRGVCTEVIDDPGKVVLKGRQLRRYAFEPGDTTAQIIDVPLGPLTLSKADYSLRVTETQPIPTHGQV